MLLESKVLLSSNFFHTNLLSFLEVQTLIKSHSLMPGASNLAILIFSTCFFHFRGLTRLRLVSPQHFDHCDDAYSLSIRVQTTLNHIRCVKIQAREKRLRALLGLSLRHVAGPLKQRAMIILRTKSGHSKIIRVCMGMTISCRRKKYKKAANLTTSTYA